MSYIPTEWLNGDVITAEKLNKIENGIAGAQGDADTVTQSVNTISQQVDNLSSNVHSDITRINLNVTQNAQDIKDIDSMLSTATCDDAYPTDIRIFVYDGTISGNRYQWLTLQQLVDILPPSSCDE
jgi:hypothetical protein